MANDESLEEKKEQMRRYIQADRKLEKLKDRRARSRSRGCIGSILRLALIGALAGAAVYLVWLWHPWDKEFVTQDAREHPGICSPGVEGTRTVEYFTLFGKRVTETGESTICSE